MGDKKWEDLKYHWEKKISLNFLDKIEFFFLNFNKILKVKKKIK